jgi:hypothetical protein
MSGDALWIGSDGNVIWRVLVINSWSVPLCFPERSKIFTIYKDLVGIGHRIFRNALRSCPGSKLRQIVFIIYSWHLYVLFIKRWVIYQIHKEIFASVSWVVTWRYPASPWRTKERHPEIHSTSYFLIRFIFCDDMISISRTLAFGIIVPGMIEMRWKDDRPNRHDDCPDIWYEIRNWYP